MPRFLVTRQERWDQMVLIDALTEEDAKRRAYKGLGVISSDPEFVDYINRENWNVERLKEEEGDDQIVGASSPPSPSSGGADEEEETPA